MRGWITKPVLIFSALCLVGGTALANDGADMGGGALSGGIVATMRFFKATVTGVQEAQAAEEKADKKSAD